MSNEMNAPSEMNLPNELSEVETLLQQFAPANSAIDRDALMYQAGWDAAQLQAPRTTQWLWPATSAALAATLLLLITFPPSPQARPLQRSGTAPTSIASQSATQPAEPKPKSEVPIAEQRPAVPEPARTRRRYLPTAPLLVMRDRALRQDFDDFPVDVATGEIPVSTETTNRQLLKEFLPSSPTPATSRLRFWSGWNLGETT